MDTPHVASKLTLLERVRRLFKDDHARVVSTTDRSRSAATRRDGKSVSGAHFKLVGLGEVRERLGERWPQLSARVHDLAEAVIRRHLIQGDVFDTHGEDGYIILFTQLTEAQAEFKCRVIAKEIAAKLLGADWAGRSTDGLIFQLPAAALSAPSFEEALSSAIENGRPVVSAQSESPADASRRGGRPATVETVTPAAASQTLKPIPRDRAGTSYTPVWDFAAQALLHFRYNTPSQSPSGEAGALFGAKTDLAALNQVLFDVSRLTQVGRRLPVICPIRLETLLRESWRVQIARMARGAPPPLRKLVTLEIVTNPGGDGDWLRSLEATFPAICGRPIARISLAGPSLPSMRSSLVGHLNLALPNDFSATKTGIAALSAFVQQAERAGMTCGVLGVRTRATALAATAAGFRQLSGPAIHPDAASLTQAIRFDLQSLYRDLLPSTV